MENMFFTLADDVPGLGRAGTRIQLDGGRAYAQQANGDRVTLELRPNDVREAQEIETYVAGYRPGPYRADEVSPVILRPNDTDKYRTFSSDDAFLPVNVKAGSSSRIAEIDPDSSLDTYLVVPRVVGSFVPAVTMGQTSTFDAMMVAGRRARRAIDMDRELDVFRMLFGTTTNWDASVRTVLGAGFQWNGGASSNPIKDLQDAKEKSAQPVTGFWMNEKVANNFLRHAEVKDHMRQFFGDAGVQQIANSVMMASVEASDFAIPGLGTIHVTAAKYKNDAGNLVYIAPDYVWLVGQPPGIPTSGEEIATSYTFRREGPSGTGVSVREVEIGERGELGGTLIVVSMADIAKMTGPNVGGIITGVIQ